MHSMLKKIPITESDNPASANIDLASTSEIVAIINNEDKKIALAVEQVLPQITKAIDAITERVKLGGRIIYFGAGTSGRLGVLDASEMPPTFGTPADDDAIIIGCIAGGKDALTTSIEGAEDKEAEVLEAFKKLNISNKDAVVGISANGNPLYVLTAILRAKEIAALTVGISCNPESQLTKTAEINIPVIVGPEVITGSSRMKAGTAQKLILNTISTAVMIKIGKTYGNLMVDLRPVNKKLVERQKRIVSRICNISEEVAEQKLTECKRDTKVTIVSLLHGISPDEARERLANVGGIIRKII